MGIPVLIYGVSGSGKSRSMKNFKNDEVFLINAMGKRLPFKTKWKYEWCSRNSASIISALKKMPTKTAVIDDAGYIMTERYMSEHHNKSGGDSYAMYDNIGDDIWFLLRSIIEDLPDDVIVYIMMHEDETDRGRTKLRTIGKLLDNKVGIEGMVTICLHCVTDGEKHVFHTQNDGGSIAKSPEEMFEEFEIENDLKSVDAAIRNYYEIEV